MEGRGEMCFIDQLDALVWGFSGKERTSEG